MSHLDAFLNPEKTSLKICGITLESDAHRLVEMGVDAMGFNFWPKSKRFLNPQHALWLAALRGKTLRVGVFVNAQPDDALRLYDDGLLDAIQLHGDESPQQAEPYRKAGVPFFKAIGVSTHADLAHAADYGARAILLDAHAPGVYGGTGAVFDWGTAREFRTAHPQLPMLLAGGITPQNAAQAIAACQPAALDVASGAEVSPGIKDFAKVALLLQATRAAC